MTEKEIEIAEDICELNCFRTPLRLKKYFGRHLSEKEIGVVFNALQEFVPYSKWIKVWQDSDWGTITKPSSGEAGLKKETT